MYKRVPQGIEKKQIDLSLGLHFHLSLSYDNGPQWLVHVIKAFLFQDLFLCVHSSHSENFNWWDYCIKCAFRNVLLKRRLELIIWYNLYFLSIKLYTLCDELHIMEFAFIYMLWATNLSREPYFFHLNFCSNVQNSLHMMYFHIPIIVDGANSA